MPRRTGLRRGTKSDVSKSIDSQIEREFSLLYADISKRTRLPKKSIKWTFIPSRFSLLDLQPAPPDFANNASEVLLLDGLSAKGRKVIADFVFLVLCELQKARDLDASPPGPPPRMSRSPALRQKLKSVSKRLDELVKMALSEGQQQTTFLVHAQSDLEEFQKKKLRNEPRLLTGRIYLRQRRWFLSAPAIAYALFRLLRKHGRRHLAMREIYKRISIFHSAFLHLNVEITSIEKQITRFAADEPLWHIHRLLGKIERLPRFRA